MKVNHTRNLMIISPSEARRNRQAILKGFQWLFNCRFGIANVAISSLRRQVSPMVDVPNLCEMIKRLQYLIVANLAKCGIPLEQ